MKNLVLIGGGHSHSIVLRLLGINPFPGIKLTLITDTLFAPYSGMLPGHLNGKYSFSECHIDLQALAQFAQAQLILDQAIGLDLQQNKVFCRNHAPINFDWLSIDIGSTPATNHIPGAQEYAIAAKPVPQFLAVWQQLIQQTQLSPQPISLGIVGGGAGGVELALNLQKPLQNLVGVANVSIHLFHRQPALMNSYHPAAQQRFQQLLVDRGINLHLNETVIEITNQEHLQQIHCQSGLTIVCQHIIWVTQAAAPQWISQSGLATDEQGFILIQDTLQSLTYPHIFATGDIATMPQYPRPKAGVFAVRQGHPLYQNLQRITSGQKLRPFHPQQNYLSLIGLGDAPGKTLTDRQAIAIWGNICTKPARLLWWWKNWIDRRFMTQFHQLPQPHA
jgi:selenide, water dikinase